MSLAYTPPLPVKDGVAPSYLWLPPGKWPDLLSFLLQYYPAINRETWLRRIAQAELVDGQGRVLAADTPYQPGLRIFYYRELPPETPIPFTEQILYQDEHLIVVDKPHFLPVIPTGRFLQETLLVRLRKRCGIVDLAPLHRLDRETAGIVVFSCNPQSRGRYQVLFQQRNMEKEYEALAAPLSQQAHFPFLYASRIVKGEPFFCMKEEVGPANAQTWVDVLARHPDHWHYRLRPLTGRTHQLRVHMAALGVPILNDAFYPQALPCKGDDVTQPLQLLARALSFTDPLTGQERRFVSQRELGRVA